ncbi:MAG: patatin-like phospholipase family protein [Bacteroidales bacterium]|jgi:NTE family protein|nr:patatin-like phospholipase family protein [Bacteroidales bacterium]MDD3151490.1 patatin-like phospholipase family protein [Bacteroidales bacterium]MDD3914902.1 patatin-like phospholipase family protein [Bacteroidales bacterium]MDD4634688.1 patatin-like phospholipase family protein [Bacteroidales bacterium]
MKKYKLGIAFSGGGAKGAAHCGAIQALEEFGIKADVVAGTSAGSIVASLYASGVSPIDMCNMFGKMEFKDLLGIRVPRAGLFSSKPLVEHIAKIVPYKNIEDTPIPLYVVACNLDKGKVTVFNKGELAPRVAASCSIPIVFYPMIINGVHYVDGGVFQNLPVSSIREKCEKVIGISVHHAKEMKFENNMIAYAIRSFYLMFISNTLEDAAMSDMFVELDTTAYNSFDLSNIEELFNIGYNTTVKKLEEAGYQRVKPKEQLTFIHQETKSQLIQKQIKEHIIKRKEGNNA